MYEPMNFWENQSPVTQEQMHKISRNQGFINQLKGEARLRNIASNGEARRTPNDPFKTDRLVIYSNRFDIVCHRANTNPDLTRISHTINFPSNDKGNFFSGANLPVVNLGLSRSTMMRAAVIIREVNPTFVRLQIVSFGRPFTPELPPPSFAPDSFSLNIYALGVKGPALD